MAALNHRSDLIFYNGPGSKPAWAGNFTVTTYRAGAQVSAASAAKAPAVRANHGFVANDKLIIFTPGATAAAINATFRKVTAASALGLTLDPAGANLTVAVGDVLVNLGPDTGTVAPNYDGSNVSTYSDMGGAVANAQNRVTADATGSYEYWTNATSVWELIRNTAGLPVAVVKDAAVGGADTAVTTLNIGGGTGLISVASALPSSSPRYYAAPIWKVQNLAPTGVGSGARPNATVNVSANLIDPLCNYVICSARLSLDVGAADAVTVQQWIGARVTDNVNGHQHWLNVANARPTSNARDTAVSSSVFPVLLDPSKQFTYDFYWVNLLSVQAINWFDLFLLGEFRSY